MPKPKIAPAQHDPKVFDNTVCFRVELSTPGAHRQVRADQIGEDNRSLVKTDADPDEITVSKDILGSDEFERVTSMDNVIRSYVRSRSLNTRKGLKILAKGVYLIPLDLVEDTDKEVQALIAKRHNLINAFIKAYPQIIEKKKEKLSSLFDESEFPDAAKLRQAFRENVYVFSFDVPSQIGKLNKALFRRESEKMRAMWIQAADDIKAGLREGFFQLIKRAADTLGTNEAGRKKRFHESTIEQITEFLELFDKKNITNDNELHNLVQQARNVIKGQSAHQVFKRVSDDIYRDRLREEFASLAGQMERLVDDSERMVEI